MTRRFPLALVSTLAALLLTAAPAFAAGTEALKVSVTGAGTVTGAGIECGNGAETCEAQFAAKSVITLTATPTERSTFAGWLGCEEVPSPTKCRVRINAGVQTDVSAEFSAIPQETLSVVDPGSGAGGGSIFGNRPGSEFSPIRCGDGEEECEQEYNPGAKITLEATPNERSKLEGWTGCTAVPSPTECEVEMTEAKTVKAKFAPIPQQNLSVSVEGSGQGTLTAFPGGEFAAIECGSGATACEASYNQGAVIVLTARPATHSKFAGWEGCPNVLSSNEFSSSECEVTMSAAKSVKAEFDPISQQNLELSVTGPGEVTSSPPGIACTATGGTCTEHFDSEGPESAVTLFASPPTDHHVAWSGCETASENECTVSMSTAKSVTAEFPATMHTLFLTRTGAGEVTSSPPGIACDEDLCSAEFQEGVTVLLIAKPAAHNRLSAWGAGECTEEPSPTECEVEIGSSSTIVQAEFAPLTHTLAVAVNGGGSVSASTGAITDCAKGGGVCMGEYDEGSSLVLTASPFPHSTLPTWSGCTPKPNPSECEVTIGSSGETIHADFPPNMQTLTVEPAGAGIVGATSGAIKGCETGGGVCAGTYIEAATVVLSATPAPHQAVAWEGCTHSSENTCEVEIGASDANVTATFSQITRALSLAKAGTGQGTLVCNGAPCTSTYPEGTALTITASPAAGSTFAGWSGGDCSGTGACQITLESDIHLTASFSANPPPLTEEKCVVPTLAGRTLAQARSALTAAHCSLGKVTKPKPKKGHQLGPLLVKSSSPAAGTTLPTASKVNLTLGPKPKKGKK